MKIEMHDPVLTEFERKLVIDPNALDGHVAEQADIYYRVAQAYTTANDLAETAKAQLDIVDGEVALRIRSQAEREGAKITEGRISEQVLTSTEHLTALAEYQSLRARAQKLNDLRQAYQQRAEMLKRMVDLYIGQYFTVSAVRSGQTKVGEADAANGREALRVRRRTVTT